MPAEFSFGATLRMNKRSLRSSWDIIHIDDFANEPQFAIKMNGIDKQILVIYRNYNYQLITVVFGGGAIEQVSI